MNEYDNKIIGKQIQKYRLSKGYSVKELSRLTGISESYIRDLEHGSHSDNSSVSMEKICKIAGVLNVSLDDIACTNVIYMNGKNNNLIAQIERELKTLSKSELILFEKIVSIFAGNHKN
ncbi:hypothetical protein IMSAG049_00659 [Clostridiales bacterium]|nr:hypothetical protein IMSAG049_00659 [Clostridiales bacterium]